MSKRYEHECPDWDFMVIDEDSAELVGCSCFSDPEFLAVREGHSKELDRANEADECATLKAAISEIAAGFLPDGTYSGRPIYEIAPQCFQSETEGEPK